MGPLFAWRRTSTESLRRNFTLPGIAALVLAGVLLAAGMRSFYALISFGFCLFVTLTIFMEFYRGSRAIAQKSQINFAHAVIELTHRNTRRYGGYLVHMGIVLMFIGFTGTAFYQQSIGEMKIGDTARLGAYEFKVARIEQGENDNYRWQRAIVEASRNGKALAPLAPEGRLYKSDRSQLHAVAINWRLNEDFYLNFAGMNDDRAVIQAYVFPLISWIWIGAIVLVFGTLVALVPSKVKREYARTEVVGVTRKHVAVER